MSIRSRRANKRLFADCVNNNRGAHITFPELDRECPANFVEMHRGLLDLQVPSADIPAIRNATLCCVTFQADSMQHDFLSLISGYQRMNQFDLGRISVAIPRRLRRSALRVRVPGNSGLGVRVTADGGYFWAPRAVNLSVAGILLDFDKYDTPNLPVGIRLDVVMMLGTDAVTRHAEVLRRDRHQYGLRFRDVHSDAEMDPPSALRRIVQRLEQQCVQEKYCSESDCDPLSIDDPFDGTTGRANPVVTMEGGMDATMVEASMNF